MRIPETCTIYGRLPDCWRLWQAYTPNRLLTSSASQTLSWRSGWMYILYIGFEWGSCEIEITCPAKAPNLISKHVDRKPTTVPPRTPAFLQGFKFCIQGVSLLLQHLSCSPIDSISNPTCRLIPYPCFRVSTFLHTDPHHRARYPKDGVGYEPLGTPQPSL